MGVIGIYLDIFFISPLKLSHENVLQEKDILSKVSKVLIDS